MMDSLEQMDNKVLQVLMVLPATLELLALKDQQEHQELMERQVLQDHKDQLGA